MVQDLDASTTYHFRVRAETTHRDGAFSDGSAAAMTATVGASISATNPDPLTETSLDGARLTVALSGATFSTTPGDR